MQLHAPPHIPLPTVAPANLTTTPLHQHPHMHGCSCLQAGDQGSKLVLRQCKFQAGKGLPAVQEASSSSASGSCSSGGRSHASSNGGGGSIGGSSGSHRARSGARGSSSMNKGDDVSMVCIAARASAVFEGSQLQASADALGPERDFSTLVVLTDSARAAVRGCTITMAQTPQPQASNITVGLSVTDGSSLTVTETQLQGAGIWCDAGGGLLASKCTWLGPVYAAVSIRDSRCRLTACAFDNCQRALMVGGCVFECRWNEA